MRIITWNLQGSSHGTEDKWNRGLLPLMQGSDGADVLCVQECGKVPDSAEQLEDYGDGFSLWTWAGTGSRPGVFILFYNWDVGAHRCNLAIVSKTRPDDPRVLLPADGAAWRPVIGAQYGDWYVFSIHAISGGGYDVKGLLQAVVDANLGAWLVAGDFNREPGHTFPDGDWIVCPPNHPTHPATDPQRRFDYVVAYAEYGESVSGQVLDIQMSDHLAVRFDL